MIFYYFLNVVHATVTYFYSVSIAYLVEFMFWGEAFGDQRKEMLTYVGPDSFVVGRVVPCYESVAFSTLLLTIGSGVGWFIC